jgi:hypothetical protein
MNESIQSAGWMMVKWGGRCIEPPCQKICIIPISFYQYLFMSFKLKRKKRNHYYDTFVHGK